MDEVYQQFDEYKMSESISQGLGLHKPTIKEEIELGSYRSHKGSDYWKPDPPPSVRGVGEGPF